MPLRKISDREWLAELDLAVSTYRRGRAEFPAKRKELRAQAIDKLKAIGISAGDAERYLGKL